MSGHAYDTYKMYSARCKAQGPPRRDLTRMLIADRAFSSPHPRRLTQLPTPNKMPNNFLQTTLSVGIAFGFSQHNTEKVDNYFPHICANFLLNCFLRWIIF